MGAAAAAARKMERSFGSFSGIAFLAVGGDGVDGERWRFASQVGVELQRTGELVFFGCMVGGRLIEPERGGGR